MAHSSFSPAARPAPVRRSLLKGWHFAATAALLILITAFVLISANWPYRHRKIRPLLEDVLASQVVFTDYHRTYFPYPGFIATGITMRRKTAPDLPPLGSVEKMVVQGRWTDLLMLRQRVKLVEISGLHIVVPAIGSAANREDFPPGSSSGFEGPDTLIETLHVDKGLLDIMRDDGNRYSFPIQHLELRNLYHDNPILYSIDMRNALPTGRIQARGSFGPLNSNDIGRTPISGEFTFTGVELHDVGEISGTLSSRGKFSGNLAAIEAEASSNTPDFAVENGHPTPVAATIRCTISGLNGDVVIHEVKGHTGRTDIHVSGSIAGTRKVTNLDMAVSSGRTQDILRIFVHDEVPVVGPVRLHGHAYIAPTEKGVGFLSRLRVDAVFDIPTEKVTDRETEQSLTAFSDRAQGLPSPDNNQAQKSLPSETHADALSSIKGPAQIRSGIATTQHLVFQVAGAQADLKGTFNFHNKVVHLVGDLKMDKDISHTSTGFKSLLLKPLAPFFKKKNAGAVFPIAVTGGPGHYKVDEDIIHKK